jgi:nucleotide-binding universal stress UspA family protein
MFHNILLAYDESKEAKHALESALSLAKTLRSKLTIVTVVEALPGYTAMAALVDPNLPNEILEEKRDRLRSLQKTVLNHAFDSGIKADAVLVEGEEVESIIETAKRDRADLLVIGLRKHAAFEFVSGTAHHLAQQSPCPLLAVS